MTESNTIKSSQPLNQILFGPPGTGKTYNTLSVQFGGRTRVHME